MAIDKIFDNASVDSIADNLFKSVSNSVSEVKAMQQRKAAENVQLVVQALKKIEVDLRQTNEEVAKELATRIASIKDGKDGKDGSNAKDGRDGRPGRDGAKGDKGDRGLDGRNGIDGKDGISVTDAKIDFDGSLIITLSTGQEINVGEVVSPDLAQKIQVISTMSTNGAVGIKDEGSSISTGVKNINFVGAVVTATNSGDDVTVNISAGTGTVTSVAATGGTGISVSGSPITTSGTLTITNTAPDQTVALTQGGTTTITGTYPNFTISSADQFVGTVTSVTGTSPVVSSGGTTPAISLASGYGDTLNPYASKTANFVLAAPNGSAGVPTFRAVVAADIPTLNQSTTGNAATVTTNANLTGAVTSVGNATSLGSFTSAELAGALTDETGSGAAVFATSPTLVTPVLGAASATSVTVAAGTVSLPAITTTGDTNTGIYFPAADTIAFAEGGAEAMRIDSSGNLLVGSTSGTRRLNVQTPAAGGSLGSNAVVFSDFATATMELKQSTTENQWSSNTSMSFATNGAEAIRIDSSRNVGIGTSSPNGKLAVIPSANPTTVATSTTLTLGEATNNSAYQLRLAYPSLSSVFTGVIDAVQNSLGAPLALNPTGGNVGIGTTVPTNKLHVVGTAKIEGSTLDLNDAGTFTISQNTSSSALILRTATSSFLRFDTNGSNERMRIDSSGFILVNQTSNTTSSYVQIFGAQPALSVESTSTGAVSQVLIRNPNGTVGSIGTSGSSTSFNTSSDYRLKNTIAPMTGALDKVALLKPVTYKWNVDGSDGQGFIAHELNEVVSGCVTGEKDAVDADGNPVYQGIDTSFLVATLTAAIQELKAIVDAQGAEIAALKGAAA